MGRLPAGLAGTKNGGGGGAGELGGERQVDRGPHVEEASQGQQYWNNVPKHIWKMFCCLSGV